MAWRLEQLAFAGKEERASQLHITEPSYGKCLQQFQSGLSICFFLFNKEKKSYPSQCPNAVQSILPRHFRFSYLIP